MRGLFVFRRDLRKHDNTGLIKACQECDKVYAIFILDPKQITPRANKYFTYTGFLFMLQSLLELKSDLPTLSILQGIPHEVIKKLVKQLDINRVYINEDYTPYSVERDQLIENAISKHKDGQHKDGQNDKDKNSKDNITENKEENKEEENKKTYTTLVRCTDYCMNSPHDIKPYKVYTAYYNFVKSKKVNEPKQFTNTMYNKTYTAGKSLNITPLIKWCIKGIKKQGTILKEVQFGGRSEGLRTLHQFVKDRLNKYGSHRDSLLYETSRVSPHLKFGTISIREVYHACSANIYRKELYWRDFYMQIAYHFPDVFGYNFRHKIKWVKNAKHFQAWCNGKTGYDIVDAAMMQLNLTGFMHNRARMIVASFLTKILHIDWRMGEQYFATRLTDYDPCSNNGGWQWSAGTGTDAQPYFRIFNPYTQAERFDPDGKYIKKWLKREPMEPIVDYDVERKRALTLIQ